ncbi:MAG: TIGR03885 family FMN-dependent LLM class oxidoreductase [Verrucomicrobiales bacterium]
MMIGYHASHEQFSPRALLNHIREAEAAGFDAFMCSDHFAPWSAQQDASAQAWVWLGAALETCRLPGGFVVAPGSRYHPAIVAQTLGTLANLFPERIWAALGSGQYLNEHVTGEAWPSKPERNARLQESFEVIRKMLQGDLVNHRGHVVVRNARLYPAPTQKPPLFVAAITAKTARWAAPWAEGLITVGQTYETMREVVRAFRENGGDNKPIYVQEQISYARTDEEARRSAYEQWGYSVFPSTVLGDLEMPERFDEVKEFVRPEDAGKSVRISSNLDQHRQWLSEISEIGFDRIYLHNVGPNQTEFIQVFGEKVLPKLK